MPIVLKHQAAGIAPSPENPKLKYGMTMALQQQRADQEMRQRTQDAQYDMQRMGAMGQARTGATREPSRAERREMLDMQIRNGAVPQGLIKPLRDLAGEEIRIMRDRGLNAKQMGEALSGIDSQMDVIMSSAYPQQMAANRMQQAQANQQPAGPPSAREAFKKDRKLFGEYTARAQATFEGAENDPTPQMILDRAGELFDTEQAWLNANPAAAAPQGQGQPPAPAPNAPTAAPAAATTSSLPPGSFTGGEGYGESSPVLAQAAAQPMANMNAPAGPGAYQPGDYTPQEVFGAPNVLTNTAQPMQQQPAPMQTPATPAQQQPEKKGKRGYISIAPGGGQSAGQPAGQASGGWKSKSTGVYSPDGKFLGDPSLYDEAGAKYIQQQAVQPAAAKPPVATSGRDAAFNAALGSNLDTAYDLANMDRSPGTNYFNPENPEYARMRGADPNIMNPPKNVGKFKGRYGLGGMDYGINPATGNRVTASVRPGGGLEYDEPTGGPRRGGVTVMGGKNKPAPAAAPQRVGVEVSPGEGVDPKYAALPVSTPANSSDAAAYQYQSPLAQAASAAMSSPQPSAPAAPASKYGRSASTSALGREVDAAMQAGEELEANEQQRAVEIATSPSPEPMSDAERKRLGLPTLKEMEEMRKSIDRNKTMGGIGLGGTGRAAGSYEPIKTNKLPKGKGASAAAQQKKASPQQTGMSQSLTDFASKQRPDVQNAIKEAYDPKLSERARENAIRFLLTQGIDLSEIL